VCEKVTDRKISLTFECAECGRECKIESEEDLFDLVDSQDVAEGRKLLCWNCAMF
jgi:hypothetical protein